MSHAYADQETGRVYRDALDMVNHYIERFGRTVDVKLDPLDEDGYTDVRRGRVTIGINVLDSRGVLICVAKLMDLPENEDAAFYRKLLELNFVTTSSCAFAIDAERDAVYVRALRRLRGLSYHAFDQLLRETARFTDDWSKRLAANTTE